MDNNYNNYKKIMPGCEKLTRPEEIEALKDYIKGGIQDLNNSLVLGEAGPKLKTSNLKEPIVKKVDLNNQKMLLIDGSAINIEKNHVELNVSGEEASPNETIIGLKNSLNGEVVLNNNLVSIEGKGGINELNERNQDLILNAEKNIDRLYKEKQSLEEKLKYREQLSTSSGELSALPSFLSELGVGKSVDPYIKDLDLLDPKDTNISKNMVSLEKPKDPSIKDSLLEIEGNKKEPYTKDLDILDPKDINIKDSLLEIEENKKEPYTKDLDILDPKDVEITENIISLEHSNNPNPNQSILKIDENNVDPYTKDLDLLDSKNINIKDSLLEIEENKKEPYTKDLNLLDPKEIEINQPILEIEENNIDPYTKDLDLLDPKDINILNNKISLEKTNKISLLDILQSGYYQDSVELLKDSNNYTTWGIVEKDPKFDLENNTNDTNYSRKWVGDNNTEDITVSSYIDKGFKDAGNTNITSTSNQERAYIGDNRDDSKFTELAGIKNILYPPISGNGDEESDRRLPLLKTGDYTTWNGILSENPDFLSNFDSEFNGEHETKDKEDKPYQRGWLGDNNLSSDTITKDILFPGNRPLPELKDGEITTWSGIVNKDSEYLSKFDPEFKDKDGNIISSSYYHKPVGDNNYRNSLEDGDFRLNKALSENEDKIFTISKEPKEDENGNIDFSYDPTNITSRDGYKRKWRGDNDVIFQKEDEELKNILYPPISGNGDEESDRRLPLLKTGDYTTWNGILSENPDFLSNFDTEFKDDEGNIINSSYEHKLVGDNNSSSPEIELSLLANERKKKHIQGAIFDKDGKRRELDKNNITSRGGYERKWFSDNDPARSDLKADNVSWKRQEELEKLEEFGINDKISNNNKRPKPTRNESNPNAWEDLFDALDDLKTVDKNTDPEAYNKLKEELVKYSKNPINGSDSIRNTAPGRRPGHMDKYSSGSFLQEFKESEGIMGQIRSILNMDFSISPFFRTAAEWVGKAFKDGETKQHLIDAVLKILTELRDEGRKLLASNPSRLPGLSGDENLLEQVGNYVGTGSSLGDIAKKAATEALYKNDYRNPINRPVYDKDRDETVSTVWGPENKKRYFSEYLGLENITTTPTDDTDKKKKLLNLGKKDSEAISTSLQGASTIAAEGLRTTFEDLLPKTDSTPVSSLEDLKRLLSQSPYVTTAKKVKEMKMTLDSNHVWEIRLFPYLGPLNGNCSWLPNIAEMNSINWTKHRIKTTWGDWIPANSFELQSKKLSQKTLGLFDGEISYPVSMEFTNELRITFVDDQYKTWKRYFELCAECSTYLSGMVNTSENQVEVLDDDGKFGGKKKSYTSLTGNDLMSYADTTPIVRGVISPGMYKNLSFRCLIYVMTPQLSTIQKFDLLLVMKDYSIDYTGEIDASSPDLTISFSVVGENPDENIPGSSLGSFTKPKPEKEKFWEKAGNVALDIAKRLGSAGLEILT